MNIIDFEIYLEIIMTRSPNLDDFVLAPPVVISDGEASNDCIFDKKLLQNWYMIFRHSALTPNKLVTSLARIELYNGELPYRELTSYWLPGTCQHPLTFRLTGKGEVKNDGIHLIAYDKSGYSQYYNLVPQEVKGKIVLLYGSNDATFFAMKDFKVANKVVFKPIEINRFADLLRAARHARGLKHASEYNDIAELLSLGEGETIPVIHY